MSNRPLITIITASYNSARTIRDTLDSVAGQCYPHIEHLIVDGGSTDETLDIIQSYPHISRVISESDRGIYDAMNKGIRIASGQIIGILNSDDFYAHSEVITRVVNRMLQTRSRTLYGDLIYIDPLRSNRLIRYWVSGVGTRRSWYLGWMPPHPTFFVDRSIYETYGCFNETLKSAADYEIMLRFLFKHEVETCYLPEVIVHMRDGGQSSANLRNRWRGNREDRRAWLLNGLRAPFYTTLLKPLRKISQFWRQQP